MIHQAAHVLRTWHVQWQTHLLCLGLSLWSRVNRVPLEHTEWIAFSQCQQLLESGGWMRQSIAPRFMSLYDGKTFR